MIYNEDKNQSIETNPELICVKFGEKENLKYLL